MLLRVNGNNSTPVYAQIVEQIKRAIATGAAKSGDPLPSLRETALKLRVNPLTVTKAYKQLEAEGLVETRHGLGSFISGNVKGQTSEFRQAALTQAVDDLLIDARHLGVSVEEVRRLLEERIKASAAEKSDPAEESGKNG